VGNASPLTAVALLLGLSAAAADGPIERWAQAVGGRDRVAAITSIYREATIDYGGFSGTLKVWHTADGKYRKEERMGKFSLVETFDGVTGTVKQGSGPQHAMSAAELQLATSRRFANASAMLFAFFPERRKGSVAVEDANTVVLRPDGGVEWRVLLDPQTALPKTMIHKEGELTVTVTFDSYETVDGIAFEKELHRSAGDAERGSVIRFTKTVLNGPADASLFSLPAALRRSRADPARDAT
jgi:hypothetical protein